MQCFRINHFFTNELLLKMAKNIIEIKSLIENPHSTISKKIGFNIKSNREVLAIQYALKWAYNIKPKNEQKKLNNEWN